MADLVGLRLLLQRPIPEMFFDGSSMKSGAPWDLGAPTG